MSLSLYLGKANAPFPDKAGIIRINFFGVRLDFSAFADNSYTKKNFTGLVLAIVLTSTSIKLVAEEAAMIFMTGFTGKVAWIQSIAGMGAGWEK
jgi:hypothetical protein